MTGHGAFGITIPMEYSAPSSGHLACALRGPWAGLARHGTTRECRNLYDDWPLPRGSWPMASPSRAALAYPTVGSGDPAAASVWRHRHRSAPDRQAALPPHGARLDRRPATVRVLRSYSPFRNIRKNRPCYSLHHGRPRPRRPRESQRRPRRTGPAQEAQDKLLASELHGPHRASSAGGTAENRIGAGIFPEPSLPPSDTRFSTVLMQSSQYSRINIPIVPERSALVGLLFQRTAYERGHGKGRWEMRSTSAPRRRVPDRVLLGSTAGMAHAIVARALSPVGQPCRLLARPALRYGPTPPGLSR